MINNEWGFITLPTHADPEQRAIARLKIASEMSLEHYKAPLLLTHSGGKDSCVLTELALRAEIPFEVLHAHTTADAPETVHFVRSEFARLENRGIRCSINYPLYKGRRTSMWDLISRKLMPPTRVARYCCAVLKEQNGKGRFLATGVRWAESVSRSRRRGIFEKQVSNRDKEVHIRNDEESLDALFAPCKLAAKRFVNPIVDWSNRDVWDFLHDAGIPVNSLYFCGFSRVAVSVVRWPGSTAILSLLAIRSMRSCILWHLSECWRSGADAGSSMEAGTWALRRRMFFIGGWKTISSAVR